MALRAGLQRIARIAAVAALALSPLLGGAASAETGQGAPIVFARSAAPSPERQIAPALREAPARVQLAAASARVAPVADARPDELYGYGSVRRPATRAPLDLRGRFGAGGETLTLSADAVDMGGAVVSPAVLSPAVQEEPVGVETGRASWYGWDFQGRRTASGEIFDAAALTAAHPSLPMPSLVEVTNLENGRKAVVRVNDRGPFHGGRVIDLSHGAAQTLGFVEAGEADVQVRYLGPAPRLTSAPEAAPEPSAPVVEARASAGAFVVQVGAFANPANAERVRAALSGEGEVLLDRREVAGGTLHRVRLGGWATRAEAEAARVRVAELGFAGAVVAAR